MKFPEKLLRKLEERRSTNSLRILSDRSNLVDFSSNDYLGFSKSTFIYEEVHALLTASGFQENGATGSRLLSGNHNLHVEVEHMLSNLHRSEAALLFNSGYNANLGLFSSVPQREDIIIYDEFIHASIREGILLSKAKAYKFLHNDLQSLEKKIDTIRRNMDHTGLIYVVTESVFSMDGDTPDLTKISQLCHQKNAYLIVDEAHALGVLNSGLGLVQSLGLEEDVFARVFTFGKAMGAHGAAVLGNVALGQYLTNFARSFIYTTALAPHTVATLQVGYTYLLSENGKNKQEKLQENIAFFKAEVKRLQLDFIASSSAIHCCVIPGNEKVRSIATQLAKEGFDVRPILSPTVPKDKERLRFCLHSYNNLQQISNVLEKLATFVAD